MENEIQNPQVTQTPITSPSTPQPVSQSPKSKLSFIIGMILLLLLVGGGAYYLGSQNSKAPQTSKIDIQPTIDTQNDPTDTPIVTQTPAINETANWKSFTSKICGFSLKAPPYWIVSDMKGVNPVGYNFICTLLSSPDFKTMGGTPEGLRIEIDRTPIGSTFKTVKINTLEDYITATESIQEPKVTAKKIQNKTYGKISGKYFEYAAFQNTSNFIFIQGNYIYTVNWYADYQGNYKNDIDGIVNSLMF